MATCGPAIASVRIGASRLQELIAKYGQGTFLTALRALHALWRAGVPCRPSTACRKARSRSRSPKTAAPSTRVTVEITDTSSSSTSATTPIRTKGPNNAGRDGATVAAQMLFKSLTDPYGAANGGSFRPLKVLTRAGLRLRRPRACGVRGLLRGRGAALRPDLALSGASPRRRSCRPGISRAICGTFIGGTAPRHRTPLHHRRTADRRMGGIHAGRRQHRDLQRVPRRDLQLSGRGG